MGRKGLYICVNFDEKEIFPHIHQKNVKSYKKDFHTTFIYTENGGEYIKDVMEILLNICMNTVKFSLKIDGINLWNKPQGTFFVFNVNSASMIPLRNRLIEKYILKGIKFSSDFGYQPHITFGEGDEETSVDSIKSFELEVRSLSLYYDNEEVCTYNLI